MSMCVCVCMTEEQLRWHFGNLVDSVDTRALCQLFNTDRNTIKLRYRCVREHPQMESILLETRHSSVQYFHSWHSSLFLSRILYFSLSLFLSLILEYRRMTFPNNRSVRRPLSFVRCRIVRCVRIGKWPVNVWHHRGFAIGQLEKSHAGIGGSLARRAQPLAIADEKTVKNTTRLI